MTLGAVTSTDIALTVHVASVLVGFGPLFAYPLLAATVRRLDAGALRALYRAKHVVARRIITPALPLALIAGLFLAHKEHAFGKAWVIIPMVLMVILMGLHRFVLLGGYRRLAEEAPALDHPARGLGAFSRRIELVELAAAGLVLVAVFDMAAKPFA